jgi:hypothetical protein
MRQVFERIYEENRWGNYESRSGDGSDAKGTEAIRAALSELLPRYRISSCLDIPCGDFNWMRLLDLSEIAYTGGDVVAGLVLQNQARYGGRGISFQVLDACRDTLPQVDLILCRDLLVHLSFADVRAAVRNFRVSGSKYILTTTFTARDPNTDIETGRWRPLNLQRPPFNFPQPIELIVERCTEWNGYWADKCLGLWRFEDLSSAAKYLSEGD